MSLRKRRDLAIWFALLVISMVTAATLADTPLREQGMNIPLVFWRDNGDFFCDSANGRALVYPLGPDTSGVGVYLPFNSTDSTWLWSPLAYGSFQIWHYDDWGSTLLADSFPGTGRVIPPGAVDSTASYQFWCTTTMDTASASTAHVGAACFQGLEATPSTANGTAFYNSGAGRFEFREGGTWQEIKHTLDEYIDAEQGQILIGGFATGDWSAVTPGGDVIPDYTGHFEIQDDAVDYEDLEDDNSPAAYDAYGRNAVNTNGHWWSPIERLSHMCYADTAYSGTYNTSDPTAADYEYLFKSGAEPGCIVVFFLLSDVPVYGGGLGATVPLNVFGYCEATPGTITVGNSCYDRDITNDVIGQYRYVVIPPLP